MKPRLNIGLDGILE